MRSGRTAVLSLALVAAFAAACSSDSGNDADKSTSSAASQPAASGSSSQSASSPAAPSTTPVAKTKVKVTTINSDGVSYGVGMPVIVYFSKKITDARQFQAQTKVTADGKPLTAAWYFQYSSAGNGPIEAQLRPKDYWPAHSKIHVGFPKAGTSLGKNYVSDGKLSSLDFKIGKRQIVTVDNSTHKVTVVSDGKQIGTYPTSLGAPSTPTKRGIKVIMEKGRDISMKGPGYYDAHVKDTQRLTFGGEYLHAAPWNTSNIRNGVNSSNGCTNLIPGDAETLYGDLHVGDVVTFPNATGPKMQMGQGYGLWNVSWGEYQTGGLVPTR
ncbi:L,D-transpeptidase catalytic domain [Jatrophihabitans endophyticus]|uniref:L,D-transpeptidase catalytic domain n=2 Tax=Jatrophihabitans endophyticus TaxID=1206085 RepID=A0A1M5D1F8_9ACTN|nr:L,D-transpeptidase catalytic domain [Jatrophihabitans endophyticus]